MLALARRHVALSLPDFDVVQKDMVSYRFIPGAPLLRDDVLRDDEATQEALAQTLARFLQQLHAIPAAELAAHDIPRSATARSRQDWFALYKETEEKLFPLLMSDAKEWVQRLFAPVLADPDFTACQPVFVNGDLAPYHILCDQPRGRINGIVDFGTAGLGDPAVEFSCIINVYGESFLRRMARYDPALAEHVERARFWAGTLELQWLLGGLRTQDPSWFAVHLGRARDVWPVGSGWPSPRERSA
jgi:aminoglycoside 2''-phosphotransferase